MYLYFMRKTFLRILILPITKVRIKSRPNFLKKVK